MTELYGSNNWKLTVKREAESVTILRAVTCDACAALPEELFGLPVTALGDRALCADAAAVQGEKVCVVGEPAQGEWSNRLLQTLTLPPWLDRAGDYALMNCQALQTVCLTDRPVAWGTGVLMNCRSLRSVEIDAAGGNAGDAVAYFSDELCCELDISILTGERRTIRLILPEYYEEYEENSPAHHFDYKVYGSGQPYHHVFRDRRLNFAAYDALWPKLLCGEYDASAALRLAWWRVCCPGELSAEADAGYRRFLAAHAGEALRYVLSLRNSALVHVLLERIDCPPEALRDAAALARENRDTAAVALLLEEQHRKTGAQKSFDL